MKELKLKREERYIRLGEGSKGLSGRRGFNVVPQSHSVQLSGKRWGWVWTRPTGVLLEGGDVRRHIPIIDFTRITQIIFYGLSLIFVSLGFINLLGKRRGEDYG